MTQAEFTKEFWKAEAVKLHKELEAMKAAPDQKYLEKMAEEILKDISGWWESNPAKSVYEEAIKLAAMKGYLRGRREVFTINPVNKASQHPTRKVADAVD